MNVVRSASRTVCILPIAALWVLRPAVAAQGPARCDRGCLEAMLDGYVGVGRACAVACSLAAGAVFTENGQRLELGDGLWHTVTGRGGYALKLADVDSGQAVMGTIREADMPTILVVRLKVAQQRIGEIETLVIRNQMAAESLDTIGAHRAAWSQPGWSTWQEAMSSVPQ